MPLPTLVALLLTMAISVGDAQARSRLKQCRAACASTIAACVSDGGRPKRCRKTVIKRCTRRPSTCTAAPTSTTSTTTSSTSVTSTTTTSTSSTTTTTCVRCAASGYEPNDDFDAAAPAPIGLTLGLEITRNDFDFFSLSVPAGQMATVEAIFDHAQGDLDLSVFTAARECVGGRLPPACEWTDGTFDDGHEALAVVNATSVGAIDSLWRLAGASGVPNTYNLAVRLAPWVDASSCTAVFPADVCEGRPGGVIGLIQFPAPIGDFLPASYRFETPANYRWARRELVMLVRHALYRTGNQFPGTKPLGIGDIAQRDGLTPGYDIGNLRHPESTHDQGGNIDLAYYTTLARDGVIPFNQLRIVCDANQGSNDGSFCTDTASTSHVVDLEREVYFLAQLFDSPRVRVIGVDRVIGPLLRAEAQRQRDLGLISEVAFGAFQSRLAFGDGWQFQHHRVHVSLRWWDS